jgi:hypothetical protein
MYVTKTVFIDRFISNTERGTLGRVTFGGCAAPTPSPIYSLERPWLHNTPNVSCVPTGVYAGVKLYSPTFREELYYLVGGTVALRSEDLLNEGVERWGVIAGHVGNWIHDLQGCVAFGTQYRLDHQGNGRGPSHYVRASRQALNAVLETLEGDRVVQFVIGWA